MRVRFAPSPTGHLHIGGVRAAIFNWLFARHHGGTFVVRIEDTDLERSKQEYVDSIIESLEWLGLQSDEPLVYQSKRIDQYRKVVDRLLEEGLAYPCFCEPRGAQETIENLERGVGFRYDGKCRDKAYTKEDLARPHAIRFKLPTDRKTISFEDKIRGTITVDIEQLDDFVIWRQDNMPTYNFCVVVDDLFMKITHVIRGEDHISNTPKQILLYEALGAQLPVFAHVPLILGPEGNKLSKRDASISVIEYKQQGFLSDALFNYLVRLGWSHGDQEVFTREEMIRYFDFDHVGKKGAIFDIKKLLWLNGVYIRNLPFDSFERVVSVIDNDKLTALTSAWKHDILGQLFELYKERATTIVELVESLMSLAQAPGSLEVELIKKWLSDKTAVLLREFLDRFKQMEEYDHGILVDLAKNICGEHEAKLVALAQPLRLAITGKTCSPGIFEIIALLPKVEIGKRIENLISQL